MPFLAIGVEHKSAPLSIRERVTLEGTDRDDATLALLAHPSITEAAILSTCNRTELYCFVEDVEEATDACRELLAERDPTVLPYIRRWKEMEVAEHLFRVASALESQILGEAQILGQVREALDGAQRQGTIGANLHALFRSAISCARQARAGTALGQINISVGAEAVRVAETALGSLQDKAALVIGGGEIAQLIIQELGRNGVQTTFVANRTVSVAVDLAERYGARPAALTDVHRILGLVDVVLSATSAPHYVLEVEDIPAGLAGREIPLQVFDLAIPRDVDPLIASLPGIALHDLDGLLPPEASRDWERDIRVIEAGIAAEVHEFTAWYLARRVVPVISSLRSHVEAVSRQELKRVAPQLTNLSDRERQAVESLTNRLIDKMFHHLVMRLRLAAQTDPALVDAAEFFFLHGEGSLFEHAASSTDESEVAPQ
ncbi:MAG TPA: glutamyl-tRNA reductase [Chloroflexota bacterium]